MKRKLFTVALILSLGIPVSIWAAAPKKAEPRIDIPQPIHNFGELQAGQIVNHDFVLQNTGQADLVIEEVAASCNCSQYSLGSRLIKPGGKTTLNVTLNTTGKPLGEDRQSMTILTNDPKRPLSEVKFTAYIIKNPNVSPEPVTSPLPTVWKSITPAQARTMLQSSPAPLLIDVRRPDEYQNGHIPGSILITLDGLAEAAPLKIPDKKATLLIYCRSGVRSKKAAQILVDLGYTQVYDLGGILDWPYEVEK